MLCHVALSPFSKLTHTRAGQHWNLGVLPIGLRISNLMQRPIFCDWKQRVPTVCCRKQYPYILGGVNRKAEKKRTDGLHRCVQGGPCYLPRFRLWRLRARSFLYLCLRIFLRRFLITLPIVPPVRAGAGCYLSSEACQASWADTADRIRRRDEPASAPEAG